LRDIFFDEVKGQFATDDLNRVHFLGHIPYHHFIQLLQLSSVHVYLTYPFILSRSLLEAMSVGCAIIASDTQPVREAIRHDQTGRMLSYFDPPALADGVCDLLDKPEERARLGAAARTFAKTTYDLKMVCLPRQMEWVRELGQSGNRG